jgi:hypothetical protein
MNALVLGNLVFSGIDCGASTETHLRGDHLSTTGPLRHRPHETHGQVPIGGRRTHCDSNPDFRNTSGGKPAPDFVANRSRTVICNSVHADPSTLGVVVKPS